MRRGPPPPPKKPKAPMMRFARPAMKTMIWRLERLLEKNDDPKISQLLQDARAWPTSAYGLPKEEVKQIKQRAGDSLFLFNSEFAGDDRIDF